MSITQILTTSAKQLGTGNRRHATTFDFDREYVRPASTGDPRLDLARAERDHR